ncbi:MAG: energy-coupling factor transporter transmembrane component T [Candidatus Bathyarchaeia archaeon]
MEEFYTFGKSFFHNLSPPTKVIFLFSTSLLALEIQDPIVALILLITLMVIAIYIRIPRRVLSVFIKSALIVGTALMFSWLFFSKIGEPVFKLWNGIYIHNLSILMAFSMLFRLWGLITSTMIFVTTAKEKELISGMRKLNVPYALCFIFALVIRFIPLLYKEYLQIKEAQMARALEKIDIIKRIKLIGAMIVPLLVISFKRVSTITAAIESRGFAIINVNRTFFREPKLNTKDLVTIFVLVTITIIVGICRVLFGLFEIIPGRL